MNYGYQNEIDFVNLFNNKYLKELDQNSQEFLKDIYNGQITSDEPIKCWKNKMVQNVNVKTFLDNNGNFNFGHFLVF